MPVIQVVNESFKEMKRKLLVLGLCLLLVAGAYSEPVAKGVGVSGAGLRSAQTDSLETGAFVLLKVEVPTGKRIVGVLLTSTMGEIRYYDESDNGEDIILGERYWAINEKEWAVGRVVKDNTQENTYQPTVIMSTDGEPLEAVLMLPEQDLTGSDVVVILITAENIEDKYGNIVEGPVYYSSKIAGEKLESGGVYIWETQPVRMEDLDNNLNITPLYQTNITSQVGSGEYSGITYISGNQYAVVHDKLNGGGLTLFDIPLYPDGSVGRISKSVPAGTSGSTISSRDNEGVAYVNGKLFISAEADQSIREYTLQGKETGRALDVPSDLKSDKIQGNAGFEALTYNAKTERFWTVTEKPLLADEETFLGLLRLQSFGKNLKPAGRALYLMDNPNKSEDEVRLAYAYVHGVPALAALDDGRLIVLEREVYVPNGNVLIKALGARTWTKLYLVDPVNDKSGILRKSLLTSFITSSLNLANFEGMCLGPTLEDGSQVLILIADSQNGSGGLTKEYIKVLLIR